MIFKLILPILGILVCLGVIFRIVDEGWFTNFLIVIGVVIALPISLLLIISRFLVFISRIFWSIGKISSRAILKTLVFLIIMTPVFMIFLLTSFVPIVGKRVQALNTRVHEHFDTLRGVEKGLPIRGTMVDILTEYDTQPLQFDSVEEYRDELKLVKERGERRLAVGESIISVSLGGALLISQVHGFDLFQSIVYGFRTVFFLQFGLFLIAVSVLYRVSILDILSYSGDEEFDRIEEIDAALSYQKGVCYIGFLQLLAFMLVLAMKFTNADGEVVDAVLRAYYGNQSFYDSMKLGWRRLREDKSNRVEYE